ncbi:MAG: 23S rRNA (cytosine1962-C5)-methyltransferase [bacterium]|jgi:23S rRNA (cytosine1962-C5)-methyltransferase
MEQLLATLTQRFQSPITDTTRVFHGRGHTYEGLSYINVDFFSPVLLFTLYEEPSQNFESVVEECKKFEQVSCILLQRRYLKHAPSEVVYGELPNEIYAVEKGLKFHIRLAEHQNIGFFLDIAHGRDWLRERAKGKKILNMFAYTCAFSVVALASGADSVVNIDMNQSVLNIGRQNHQLNSIPKSKAKFLPHNLFKSWGKLKKESPFDIILVDPPFYQKGSFVAENDYRKVIRRLPSLLADGGDVLATLNTPFFESSFLMDIFKEECPEFNFVERVSSTSDFPEKYPEKGLKVFHYSKL